VAYQSLLTSTRQRYHAQLAQALEAHPETVETQPELLAHHTTEAGLTAPAVGYWQRAGERSTARSAYVEAVAHLTKGLEVLQTLPDTPERTQHELDLQIALGQALRVTKGSSAPEVGHAWTLWLLGYPDQALTRSHEMLAYAQKLQHAFSLARALHDVMTLHKLRGDADATRK
jgi:hypothetical protein